MYALVLQRLILEFVGDFFYLPVWWYTKGLLFVSKEFLAYIKRGNARLAPGLWLKNIFVPMFGQTDLQGRFTSVLMRFFNVVIRSFLLFLWILFVLFLFIAWIVFPPFVLYMIYLTLIADRPF